MALSESRVENLWLEGNFAPLTAEATAFDLSVEGRLPLELEGRFLRNGPNPIGPVDQATHHWFLGDGMVHGVRLRGGRAEWYRARWVGGPAVSAALGRPGLPGPGADRAFSANTSVIGFAGRTLALVEAGALPVALDYELNSVARDDFGGTLPGSFTAHPKLDPATGELHAMCYWWPEWAGHVQYVVVAPDGRVRRTVDVPVPGMPMLHDMALTGRYAVVLDLPVTVDVALALSGSGLPFRWNPDYGARVGLLPREGEAADIVWCEVEPCYVFHPLNAYDAPDGTVVIDVCRYQSMFDHSTTGPDHLPTLDRWTIDPATRQVREERVDDRAQEFPRIDPTRVGQAHRFGYTAGYTPGFGPGPTYRHDLATGRVEAHDHGPGRGAAEPVPIRRAGGSDGDDWVLTFVYDAGTDRSELVVLDGADFTAPPVARVHLPGRVPYGFHGDWVPDTVVPPAG
jgi:carotenoid cleavage dioxygenase-like enzyme